MSALYIVATPIGNLADITYRAVSVLKNVDLILCEDTRVTKKLLSYYKISTPVLSYHQHSKRKKVEKIIEILSQNKDVAVVSDAGTPGISDPGNKLVEEVVKRFNGRIKIVPIPGSCALISAASISGFPMDKFIFMGFPPTKKKRKEFFEKIKKADYPVIIYESPYRILRTLKDLYKMGGEWKVVVAREMTKKFEMIYRGALEDIISKLEREKIKGEFVIVAKK